MTVGLGGAPEDPTLGVPIQPDAALWPQVEEAPLWVQARGVDEARRVDE